MNIDVMLRECDKSMEKISGSSWDSNPISSEYSDAFTTKALGPLAEE